MNITGRPSTLFLTNGADARTQFFSAPSVFTNNMATKYCMMIHYRANVVASSSVFTKAGGICRILSQSSSRTSTKPLLQSLHWLPIRERIRQKSPP